MRSSIIIMPEDAALDQIDDQIFIGDAESHKQAKEKGIRHILNVAKEVDYAPPKGVDYKKVPLTDDGGNPCSEIQEAVDVLAKMIEAGGKVLVHCRAGVSRSVSIVAAYYHRYEGWPLQGALEAIKEKRPVANPRVPMWSSIILCTAMYG
jgi:protein-tyrosine phosphatase